MLIAAEKGFFFRRGRLSPGMLFIFRQSLDRLGILIKSLARERAEWWRSDEEEIEASKSAEKCVGKNIINNVSFTLCLYVN